MVKHDKLCETLKQAKELVKEKKLQGYNAKFHAKLFRNSYRGRNKTFYEVTWEQ